MDGSYNGKVDRPRLLPRALDADGAGGPRGGCR